MTERLLHYELDDFDGIEVQPMARTGEMPDGGGGIFAPCSPDLAYYWSVKARRKSDGVFVEIEDFDDEAGARDFASDAIARIGM